MKLLFEWSTLALALLAAAIAFATALIVRAIQGKPAGEALANAAEASATTFAGGLLAQLVVAAFLDLGNNTAGAIRATGLYFLIWPGLIELFYAIGSPRRPLIGGNGLLWFAFIVGSGAGFFDGLRRIHDWSGLGVVTFTADMTWGLPLTVHALVIQLINLVIGKPVYEPRTGAHRYEGGFRVIPGSTFAFTQGNMLSNLSDGPGTPLYAHEQTHVLQNRVFGPFFWMTYFGWLILFGLFALIAWPIFRKATDGGGRPVASHFPMWWAYFNNPWELWAYTKNPDGRLYNLPGGKASNAPALDWPAPMKVILVIVGMGVLTLLWLLVFVRTWVV